VSPSPAELSGPRCFCRDCLVDLDARVKRCTSCGSPRLVLVTCGGRYDAARHSVLGCLSSAKVALGTLERIQQVVKMTAFISSSSGFNEQPLVANGASDLLVRLFDDRGVHGRSAIGVAELPLNMPVEIELIVQIADAASGGEGGPE